MKHTQHGFTLIELVMVIVILGILAATAIPRFVDLSADAQLAATEGVRGGLASASAINYATVAARGVGGAGVINTSGGCVNATATALVEQFDAGNPYAIALVGTAITANGANNATVDGVGDTWTCSVSDGTNTLNWTLHWAQ